MKRLVTTALCVLALASCQQQMKELTIHTLPEGATITVNGKPQRGLRTPMIVEIEQNKDVGITAIKPGYEVATKTLEAQTSTWGAILWTKNDPRAKYIEEDEVTIPLRKIPSAATYRPGRIPGYQPPATEGQGLDRADIPALRAMPQF